MSPIRYLAFAAVAVILALVQGSAIHAQMNPFKGVQNYMTDEDLRLLEKGVETLLNKGKVGSVAAWKNDTSGNFGTMELELAFAGDGIPCRRIDHVIKFRSQADPFLFHLTYCKMGDEWKIAN